MLTGGLVTVWFITVQDQKHSDAAALFKVMPVSRSWAKKPDRSIQLSRSCCPFIQELPGGKQRVCMQQNCDTSACCAADQLMLVPQFLLRYLCNSDLLLHAVNRLRSSYIGWRHCGSKQGQQHHDQKVIQLHMTLQQLQADSINDVQVKFALVQASLLISVYDGIPI